MDWRDNTRYAIFTRRTALVGAGTVVLFGGLVTRLFQLQVRDAEKYAVLAEENRVNTRLLAPPRGRILDRFGIELATNRQNFRAVLIPEQSDDPTAVVDRFYRLVPRLAGERERVLKEIARNRKFMPATLAENLSWDEFAAVNFYAPDLTGVQPDVGHTRDYPYGRDLAHVVGYVAKVAEADLGEDPLLRLPGFRIGKNGIERTIDEPLRGKAGASRVEVNAYGRVIRELQRNDGTPGDDSVLTLDMNIQSLATERVKGESASVVVMDIHNGDIYALVSAPGFDPNLFNVGISRKDWKDLVENPYKPLTNKVIQGQYPPGSTFKPVTALAALAHGVTTPDETIFCTSRMSLGNHQFHCWKKGGHGRVDLKLGIKYSCDIYFYEMARRLGVDRIADMATRLGLGQDYGLELPNVKHGNVPTSGWKRATTGVAWQQGETLITGIGQGYLLTTPLQLAVLTARLANGGRKVVPHLLRSVGPRSFTKAQAEDLGINPEHLGRVMHGMDAVSNEAGGTAFGSRITDLGDLTIAGKTGTAQVRRITMAERDRGVLKNEELPWAQRDHALFIAFAPVVKPQYAICVVVEHGGGGSKVAAPIARDIMRETLIRDPANKPPLAPIAARATSQRES